jgi:hypothetical protein
MQIEEEKTMNKQLTVGKVLFTPEESGYESPYIERLNEFIMRMINDKIIQADSYHLMRHGKLFANNTIGSLDCRDPQKPMLPDSIMCIASLTKDFTAPMFLPYCNGEFNFIPIHRTKYVVWGGMI